MSRPRYNRRRFLSASTRAAIGLGLATVIPGTALGLGREAPGDRIRVGFIGVGWKGLQGCFGSLVHSFLANPGCQAVAVCDVNQQSLDVAKKTIDEAYGNRDCVTYRDFRDLLESDAIDAVAIATPDHWHAVQAIWACRKGKDVYCEKPMSLTIREARAMVEAARRYGRVFQTGSQSRSYTPIRRACELIREGVIGELQSVHVNCGGPSVPCNLPGEETPKHIDWELWLGPAAWRPFHPWLADKNFRPFREYSGGGMTDWGCHHFDLGQWAMGRDDSGPVEILPPDGKDIPWLTYRYADGKIMTHNSPLAEGGVVFVGSEGKIAGHGMSTRWKTEPAGIWQLPKGPANPIEGAKAHSDNFLECVRSRHKPNADVEIGCRTVTVCHLGNIAYWLNRPLKWDPVAEEIIGDEEAARWLDRARREPFNVL
jgi:predicted dehydrogenase